ncbi:hypothetical protein ACSZMS_24510, partial [Aeromonas hydrophila]
MLTTTNTGLLVVDIQGKLARLVEGSDALIAALLIKSVAGWPFPNPLIPLNSLAGEQAYQALSA